MQVLNRPTTDHYGEWLNYLANILARSFEASTRTYIDKLGEGYVHVGKWKRSRIFPWIFIDYAEHPVRGANLSGTMVDADYAYDIVVENKGPDMDEAEQLAVNIMGDIIGVLVKDMNMDMTFEGVREARGIELQIMDPEYPFDPRTGDEYVWAKLRLVVWKKLTIP